ncbi:MULTISPECIES: hypothetical protein [unclassified Pseudomonas]|uniref:hypothetical protein n=1 Tax=unclassified Pseudomonas TaxID=196821 RepID=UPI0008E52ECB|nr:MULTISPECIES: hypothetical protein [unclassified Pseudomonas]SFI81360.1 hypothetical protein SAMN03159342_05049 [Pseudomonas sp. NFPP04]SFJ93372.1 hypothetical protein SAMN03159344_05052 [Pseudomonas sp. NFPP11]
MSSGIRSPVAGASTGQSRLGVDTRPLGTALPAARRHNLGLVNGAERHVDGQNLYGGMTRVGNPFVSSDDHLVATFIKNNLSLLDEFKEDGKLTQKSWQKAAVSVTIPERLMMAVAESINRPRLNAAILTKNGEITSDSLTKASNSQVGNTNPNTQSADPFHSKSDAQVIKAFLDKFNVLRDKSQDFDVLFGLEKRRYMKTDTVTYISTDPDVTDKNGQPVLDPRTRFPLKKFPEIDVYMCRNIQERGLLDRMDGYEANGYNIFGSRNDDGWLKRSSIERLHESMSKKPGGS